MDEHSAGQVIALSIVIKALVQTHPDHNALRKSIISTMEDGFREDVGARLQESIDRSILNWINGLRK